jgi:hypothetical protein
LETLGNAAPCSTRLGFKTFTRSVFRHGSACAKGSVAAWGLKGSRPPAATDGLSSRRSRPEERKPRFDARPPGLPQPSASCRARLLFLPQAKLRKGISMQLLERAGQTTARSPPELRHALGVGRLRHAPENKRQAEGEESLSPYCPGRNQTKLMAAAILPPIPIPKQISCHKV